MIQKDQRPTSWSSEYFSCCLLKGSQSRTHVHKTQRVTFLNKIVAASTDHSCKDPKKISVTGTNVANAAANGDQISLSNNPYVNFFSIRFTGRWRCGCCFSSQKQKECCLESI